MKVPITMSLLGLFAMCVAATQAEEESGQIHPLTQVILLSGLAEEGPASVSVVLEMLKHKTYETEDLRRRYESARSETEKAMTARRYAEHIQPVFSDHFSREDAEELAGALAKPVVQRWIAAMASQRQELKQAKEDWERLTMKLYYAELVRPR